MELRLMVQTTIFLFIAKIVVVYGHGRLMDPPARNVMWRYGFTTEVEYRDNFVYCGNRTVFKGKGKESSGKCGVCGDQLWGKKDHKDTHASYVIGRKYTVGQEIPIEIELTANHWGKYEMRLCPNNEPNREVTQSCFDKYPLYLAGTQDQLQFMIPKDFKKWGVYSYKVQLPSNVTCSHCVVQWTYYGGRAWNKCPNGTEAIGCGEVDIFRNCADVAISEEKERMSKRETKPPGADKTVDSPALNSSNKDLLLSSDSSEVNHSQALSPVDNDFEMLPKLPTPIRAQVCVATPMFRKLFDADDWCMQKCLSYPSICPSNMCTCPNTCDAIGSMAGKAGADSWCQGWCIIHPYKCHSEERCKCYKAEDEASTFSHAFNFEETNIFNYD